MDESGKGGRGQHSNIEDGLNVASTTLRRTFGLIFASFLLACGGDSTGPDRSELANVGMTSDGTVHTLRADTDPPDPEPVFIWSVSECSAGGSCVGHTVGETQGPAMSEEIEEASCVEFEWTVLLDYDRGEPGADDRADGSHFTC